MPASLPQLSKARSAADIVDLVSDEEGRAPPIKSEAEVHTAELEIGSASQKMTVDDMLGMRNTTLGATQGQVPVTGVKSRFGRAMKRPAAAPKKVVSCSKASTKKVIKLKAGWVKRTVQLDSGRVYDKYVNPKGGSQFYSLARAERAAGMKLV